MKLIRVLLADDHTIVREGLRLLLASQQDMQVVGEADNGRDVLVLVETLQPDLVVLDLSMPGLNGLQVTQRIKERWPSIKVVALTVHEDESYLRQMCQARADGYVLKRSAGDELVLAIHTVAGGGVHYDGALASQALAAQVNEAGGRGENHGPELSERERAVLIMFAWGYSNKEIAAELNISVKTIETYRARIAEKLGLHSRTELVRYALRQGWLKEDSSVLRLRR